MRKNPAWLFPLAAICAAICASIFTPGSIPGALAAEAGSCAEDEYSAPRGGCYPVWHGQTDSGAYYTIVIPEAWVPGKGLVIWNHGLQSYLGGETLDLLAARLLGLNVESDIKVVGEVEAEPGLGDVASIVLSQGYAMAASSYLQTGWAVFDSHIANGELYEKFLEVAAEFGPGPPGPLYLLGGSLGGIVSLRDIEEDLMPQPDGALLLCGAVAGSENWRNGFDLRMAAEAICASTEKSAFPTPWYEIPTLGAEIDWLTGLDSCTALGSRIATERKHDALQAEIDDLRARKDAEGNFFRELELQSRIGRREAEQRLVISAWKQLASNRQVGNFEQLQRLVPTHSATMLAVGLFYGTFLLPRLIQEPGKLNGAIPFHNIAVDYGDDWLNQHIGRSIATPEARRALADSYTPSGAIGDTRIVSIHTSKDGIVAVENQSVLQSRLAPEQLTVGIVAESTPTHCRFRESEVIAAWNLLQQWVEGGSQPAVADLQTECRAVADRAGRNVIPRNWDRAPDGGLHPGNRCRYAPDFDFGPRQLTVFPRTPAFKTAGNYVFDAATGVISVDKAEVAMDDGVYLFGFELVLSDPATWRFDPRNIERFGRFDGGWAHRSAIDEHSLFYLPQMTVRNDPTLANRLFDVYMRVDDNTRFHLLEVGEARVE